MRTPCGRRTGPKNRSEGVARSRRVGGRTTCGPRSVGSGGSREKERERKKEKEKLPAVLAARAGVPAVAVVCWQCKPGCPRPGALGAHEASGRMDSRSARRAPLPRSSASSALVLAAAAPVRCPRPRVMGAVLVCVLRAVSLRARVFSRKLPADVHCGGSAAAHGLQQLHVHAWNDRVAEAGRSARWYVRRSGPVRTWCEYG